MTTYGRIIQAVSKFIGTSTIGTEAAGQTVISVDSVKDFVTDVGFVSIGGSVISYSVVDRTNNAITIDTPLASTLQQGTEIRAFPLSIQRWAFVLPDSSSVPADAVWALIPHALAAFIANDGLRADVDREKVKIEQDGTSFIVVDVLDRLTVLDTVVIEEGSITPNKIEPTFVDQVFGSVKSYVTEYAVNASETVPPASGWSTSTPTRTPGTFIWYRVTVTYNDDTSTTTSPALLTGNTGATGSQGIPGPAGEDGTSLYTWLKYADTPTTGMADDPTGKTYMGIAYNKTTPVESSNYSDYAWSLIQGPQGTAGSPGKGISSTAVTYQVGTSGTTAPTGTWLSTVPATTTGQFLWTRTIITYTDTTTATAYSVSAHGATGATGSTGAAGRGVSGTTVTYQVHTNGTTAPTGTWLSTVPATSPGQYLWTRTITTYTDGLNPTTAYSVAKHGDTGAQGIQGPAGDDGQPTYTWIKYGTSATGAGLSDDPTGRPYIGIAYNKTTQTESTTPGDYTWSLIQGPQGPQGNTGATGATGVSVTSVTPYYRLVTPSGAAAPAVPTTNPPSAPWTVTEPTYTPNTDLYRTERVVFSNGTFAYSTVVKSSSYAAAKYAQETADGKNTVTYSVNPASGPNTAGDVWFQRTGTTGPIIAQWEGQGGTSWNPVTLGHQVIASLDMGKATVGELSGEFLAFDAINGKTITGAIMQTSDDQSAARVVIDTEGIKEFRLGESNPAIIISPAENKFSGSVDADNITIRDGLELFGKNNYVKNNSEITLATGPFSGSSTPPTLSNFYEVSSADVGFYLSETNGLFTDAAEGTLYGCTHGYSWAGMKKGSIHWQFPKITRSDGSQALEFDPLSYTRLKNTNGERGVVVGHRRPAGMDPSSWDIPVDLRIYNDASMTNSVAPTLVQSIQLFPTFVWDRQIVLGRLWGGDATWSDQVALAVWDGSTLQVSQYRCPNDATTPYVNGGRALSWTPNSGEALAGVTQGRLGPMKFVPVGHASYNQIVWVVQTNQRNLVFNADTGARMTTLEWPVTPSEQKFAATKGNLSDNAAGFGGFINWNSGINDTVDQKITRYSDLSWDGVEDPIWAQFAWKGHSSHVSPEWITTPSPMSVPLNRAKRSWQSIGAPQLPTPVGGVGAARDINMDVFDWVYYIGKGPSAPVRTAMWRQTTTYGDVRSRALPLTLLTSGSNTLLSTQGFTTLSPGLLKSSSGGLIIDGDGNITAKTLNSTGFAVDVDGDVVAKSLTLPAPWKTLVQTGNSTVTIQTGQTNSNTLAVSFAVAYPVGVTPSVVATVNAQFAAIPMAFNRTNTGFTLQCTSPVAAGGVATLSVSWVAVA